MVIAFFYLGFPLLLTLRIYAPYWRSGARIPRYHHGGTAASIGIFFLLMASSKDVEGSVAIMLYALSAIFSVGSAVIAYRTRRQMTSRGKP